MSLPDTKRLTFRSFTKEDADLLYQLDTDPNVMKYITLGKSRTKKEIREKGLPRIMRSYDHGSSYGIFAAFLKSTSGFIGWFQLEPDHSIPDAVEIGWRLKKEYWGKGFATEGAMNLVSIAKTLNKSIVAKAMIQNKGSIRVMEKSGLKFVKEFWGDYEPHSGKPDVLYKLKC